MRGYLTFILPLEIEMGMQERITPVMLAGMALIIGGIVIQFVTASPQYTLPLIGTIRAWQAIIPDFGTVEGPFQLSAFELSGRHDGEVAFEFTLE